jgi:hypothetical protein
LRSVELRETNETPGLAPAPEVLLLGVETAIEGEAVVTDLRVRNQSGQALRLALELYEERYGYAEAPARYAGGAIALPGDGDYRLRLDPRTPEATLDGVPFPLTTSPVADGRYYAALWVYQGEQVRRQIPLATFELRGGAAGELQALGANGAIIPIDGPANRLDATAGETIRLGGYELSATRARPGEQLRVSLLWEALDANPGLYLVFAQLLDANDTKAGQWDGAAGGDWIPSSSWVAGQRIWQDLPLAIAADAPPGRYRVVVGLYDPATGARLPLSSGGDMLVLGEVEIGP